ncbi:MBL fold metallo-hydrolase [uncultured Sphingomonas sp.]|uniref:MBL fold metallo-hydrolase n=1 Tax=uncultured Sphingomonas sp. TaxID=158754 RepID=UPI0025FF02FC|nr:MBL fold metallo-hydrolase [uncultured Sphingomonas sp.]
MHPLRALLLAALLLSAAGTARAQTPTAAPAWITLGTMGGPVPEPARSQPANALVLGRDVYLVDVGDGAVEQLAKVDLQALQVKAVFLSHLHFDHTGGLAALIGLRYQTNAPGPLHVYGPPGTKALVDGLVASMQPAAAAGYGLPGAPVIDPATTVVVTEMVDGTTETLGGFTVRAAKNSHYSFPPGSAEDSHYQSLALRFDLPGKSIVYTGDTGPSPAVDALGRGADLLVSEMIDVPATMAAIARIQPNMPAAQRDAMAEHLTRHHLTPQQVGEMAKAMGVKQVVLTHLVIARADQAAIDRAIATIHQSFPGPVTAAQDLERF